MPSSRQARSGLGQAGEGTCPPRGTFRDRQLKQAGTLTDKAKRKP
jgi:hypothetical protein